MTTRAPPISSVPDRVLSPRSAAADARRAARREQLRDFYGLKGPSPTSTTPERTRSGGGTPRGSGATSPDPRAERRDLSSPYFVPAEYYEDLISRAGLPELLKTTSTLATDIGRLHSSRHTLVYNHHHQLFSAGDTISVLNTRTPQLLSIVTDLQERFSEMSQLADSVALPDPSAVDDAVRARAVAKQGLDRIRLMLVAEESPDAIRQAWEKVEATLRGHECEGLDKLLQEGREMTGIDDE
ncbi:hypothetical protein CC85DRAFT_240017 [Cutaneotrichosporon oleaginosum]|uniref:Vacuolar protein sorting-associated protein 51 homolog n=1 Tax=Cutaneotrichosporon oleaginosum TaxID=879819 RepID=A0A0J0XY06_9TREE|nr:uncharacterized protein CC85DRAFT_240017 [Cutaneotrichosporon oleaginosum]KLT45932.1 hypothetical protein CC85DRAFT_240017 [Cutaneotrichosporon oleaginosum]TXT06629.1 hypothetical protein COLE_05960 [Cutaneotrichosporon oleaginosum]